MLSVGRYAEDILDQTRLTVGKVWDIWPERPLFIYDRQVILQAGGSVLKAVTSPHRMRDQM